MSKAVKWALAGLAVLLAAVLIAVLLFRAGRNRFLSQPLTLPAGSELTLEEQPDGDLRLSWPASAEADSYLVEVVSLEEGGKPFFSTVCRETACLLPADLPETVPVVLRVYARLTRHALGREEARVCDEPLSAALYFNRPAAEGFAVSFDPEDSKAFLYWSGWEGDGYHLYLRRGDGEAELWKEVEGTELEIPFGAEEELAVPNKDGAYSFFLQAERELPGLRFIGLPSGEVTVSRENLLASALHLDCEAEDENAWVLRWNETRGETYEVQLRSGEGEWTTVARIPAEEEHIYRTGHLPAFGDYAFRVLPLGEQTLPDSPYAARPGETEVHTRETLRFASVWPVRELKATSAPDGGDTVAALAMDRAYCVLGEENGRLLVATPDWQGYVDENYCMINLPDYIGDLCQYEITNSYTSIYMVHEYGIPKVTDTVVPGYEHVRLDVGEYLTPLLYPCVPKLIRAAEAAAEDGYQIRIYDSFRPNQATRYVFDQTYGILDLPVPEDTYFGVTLLEVPRLAEGEVLTYRRLMTDNVYNLGDFLASGVSKHNMGIAMDLTLVRLSTGAELKMQSSIHDLSWFSNIGRNNSNAQMLARVMVGAGFGGLSSEWWHFQDNDVLYSLAPPSRYEGVTSEGWTADDAGWRYRTAEGAFLTGETLEIDGSLRTFDEAGYLVP